MTLTMVHIPFTTIWKIIKNILHTLKVVLMRRHQCKIGYNSVQCCHSLRPIVINFILPKSIGQWLIINIRHIIIHITQMPWCIILPIRQFKIKFLRQPITKPPQKSLVGRKTRVEKAQTDLSKLFANFIASPNSSIFQNECATTDSQNNAQSQVSQRIIFFLILILIINHIYSKLYTYIVTEFCNSLG